MGSVNGPSALVIKATGIDYFTPANHGGEAIAQDGTAIPTLFQPLKIRDVTLRNRIIVSPMCMYSAEPDLNSPRVGAMTDYHIAHLGHFALKGAALVFVEAQAVQPNGRISPNDAGLWQHDTNSAQFQGLKRFVDFAHAQGAKVAVQLAHAGRKASVVAPWVAAGLGARALRADTDVYGWPDNVVAPTGGIEMIWAGGPDSKNYHTPRALSTDEIHEVVRAFAKSAMTAVTAGVDVIEVHGAHGYLIHQFLSPVTNRRTDEYGGTFENRTRIVREIAKAIRDAIPAGVPLFLRLSGTEWLENTPVAKDLGSWNVESTIRLAMELPTLGIDLIDVSSGGNHVQQEFQPHTHYQVDIAARVRKEIRSAGIHDLFVAAVGLITTPSGARDIVQEADIDDGNVKEEAKAADSMVSGKEPQADCVFVARQFMRDPAWVLSVAKELGVKVTVPNQFKRAF
jgi:2,4-dienoyl-CoA reductase-like NADH-dependent reductase (Old Yellow Enzyme family)